MAKSLKLPPPSQDLKILVSAVQSRPCPDRSARLLNEQPGLEIRDVARDEDHARGRARESAHKALVKTPVRIPQVTWLPESRSISKDRNLG
jgi:hypothetical protein